MVADIVLARRGKDRVDSRAESKVGRGNREMVCGSNCSRGADSQLFGEPYAPRGRSELTLESNMLHACRPRSNCAYRVIGAGLSLRRKICSASESAEVMGSPCI